MSIWLMAVAATALKMVQPAIPLSPPETWVTSDDYPALAVMAQEEGTVGIRFTVGPDGVITRCEIEASSGSMLLDATACALVKQRARYTPARARDGKAVENQKTMRFAWQLPKDDTARGENGLRYVPAVTPFALVLDADVDAKGQVVNCKLTWATGVPPMMQRVCEQMNGALIAPTPPAMRAKMLGKHVTLRASISIDGVAAPVE